MVYKLTILQTLSSHWANENINTHPPDYFWCMTQPLGPTDLLYYMWTARHNWPVCRSSIFLFWERWSLSWPYRNCPLSSLCSPVLIFAYVLLIFMSPSRVETTRVVATLDYSISLQHQSSPVINYHNHIPFPITHCLKLNDIGGFCLWESIYWVT